ncbi:YitT family protein [Ligilactobacillus faecis]|uniref:YitT family protein n=1 Tax=Ligilactobacillus faecis TaxID=762833 RepID=UPI0024692865|nr:YitT family protein [Ligilactobacillus faecis]WGN89187.1 YitT family protein [Ligilactobacillus faecis]
MRDEKIRGLDLIMIALGCCLYGLGLVSINIKNNLAEGGVTGLTLIIRYWLHIDPAISTIMINIPLIIIGYRFLGKKALLYTIYGTLALSFWIWFWQRYYLTINVHKDLFIAGVLAGIFGGAGSGIVYRFGGTTGGTDVVARILEKERGIAMGKTLLALDAIVLTLSLSYIDIRQMMYTLLASYIFSQLVNFIQGGAYAARGVVIISLYSEEIAKEIIAELDRGVSYLKGQGAFSNKDFKAIYCVVSPSELTFVKRIAEKHDPAAFISILEVTEVVGEGFTYGKK